jgi:transcriptional regulator with GAF, ATPase, and Fis domain
MSRSNERGSSTHLTTASPLSTEGTDVVRIRRLVLVFAPESTASASVMLATDSVAIGREPTGPGALTIPDTEVSRVHAVAELDPAEDRYWIVDRESRNGIFVNGVKALRAPLVHGTVIRLGRSLVTYAEVEIQRGEALEPETPALRGQSLVMQRLRGEIGLVAPGDVPVLVLGETGVGKERVAEEIHRRSGRKGPFIGVNCASIPENLAESELFGHASGAFTGAKERSDGLFVAADGGTLFLDEVGELPAALQPKLLRALAAGEVRAVGKTEARKVDVRIVAATHRDVAADVAAQTFRGDLFARLSGWTLKVPRLAARKDDVLRLARGFLEKSGGLARISASAAEALVLFDWPFNVRQLEQVLGAAAIRAAREGIVQLGHLPPEIAAPVAARRAVGGKPVGTTSEPPIEAIVARDEVPSAEDLKKVLKRFGGNLAQVADFFGKDRRQVYRWAEKYGIDVTTFRDG